MKHSWKVISLGELQKRGLADVQTGPFGTVLKASEYSKEGVPVISVGEIREGYLQVTERTPFVSANITERLPQFILMDGDIVFGRKGAIDRNSIIHANQKGWFLGSDAIRLRLSREINSVFISYQLRSKNIGKWLLQNSSGSIMASLNQKILDRLPLMIPEKSIQNRIAETLSALDSKISLNNRINAELEAMAKTIYDYWFVQFEFPTCAAYAASVGRPELEGKPYKSSGGEMVWNEEMKREVPKGWEVKKLGDLGNFKNGVNYDPSNPGEIPCPIINVRNISASSYFLKNEDLDVIYLREADVRKYSVHEGSIIIARSGIPGATRLVADFEENTLYCGFAIHYDLIDQTQKIPVFFFLKSIENLIKNGSGGTILKNVNQATLNELKIALPNDSTTLKAFNKLIEPMFSKINLIQKENQELASLRDWLLPMLMNGQVMVGEVEEYVLKGEVGMAAEGKTK